MSSEYEEEPAVVIDSGSAMTKVGFAGEDTPVVFPSIIGRDTLTIKHPIQFGTVVDWNQMEQLWQYVFTDVLSISSKDSSVLVTEPPLNPLKNRERMTQIMMEKFDTARFYVAISAVLAQYESGRGTGIVLDSGGGITHTVPVYEGYALPHAIGTLNTSGNDINEYLQTLLTQKTNKYPLNTIIDIKEKLCEVSSNQNEVSKQKEKRYELPDGKIIDIGLERLFSCTETLFKPELVFGSNVLCKMSDVDRSCLINGYLNEECNKQSLYGDVTNMIAEYSKKKEMDEGIHEVLYKSIMKCDVDIRRIVFSNIILCGGNTMFKGFTERLHEEMKLLTAHICSRDTYFKIIAPPERKYSIWIGGSILASLSTFEEMWIEKQEYDDTGPTIVHRKCI